MSTDLANFKSHRDRKCSSLRHIPLMRTSGYLVMDMLTRKKRSNACQQAVPELSIRVQAKSKTKLCRLLDLSEVPRKPPIGKNFSKATWALS